MKLILSFFILTQVPTLNAAPSDCRKNLTRAGLALAASTFLFTAPAVATPYGYVPMVHQDERLQGKEGYVVVEQFPHVEIVRDSNHEPDPELVKLIQDESLRKAINDKMYSTLMVRNLAIKPARIMNDGKNLRIPFIASVKQTLNTDQIVLLPNRGTINIGGEMLVQMVDDKVIVTVTQFDDSWWFEWLGRKLGYNQLIDLKFASAVAKPIIENWFDSDPTRIQSLINQPGGKTPLPKP